MPTGSPIYKMQVRGDNPFLLEGEIKDQAPMLLSTGRLILNPYRARHAGGVRDSYPSSGLSHAFHE